MKVLVLYDYPPTPGGLATQGDLLYKGLISIGVDAYAVNTTSKLEKEWYYKWFKPDVVVGIGYWGHTPDIILHPRCHGMKAVPWLVADGYIANYQNVLNQLPLLLVTSNWVKEMYVRDGIKPDHIAVLPVGCDTDAFRPHEKDDPRIKAVQSVLNIREDELMLLTIGGDAASKGGREVMEALAIGNKSWPAWKYVCKVWPQPRTDQQNKLDWELTRKLGIADQVMFPTSIVSRQFTPYLLGACDIYAAPSRLEGFGMIQVEAGACGKPVIGINAMGLLDTMIHEQTALLANVSQKIVLNEVILGPECGYPENQRVVFDTPRTVDFRASIEDIYHALNRLMTDAALRSKLGEAGRAHVLNHFDYRVIATKFVNIIKERLF